MKEYFLKQLQEKNGDFRNAGLSDQNIKDIIKLVKELKVTFPLDLSHNNFSDESALELRALTDVELIEIGDNNISKSALDLLLKCPNIKCTTYDFSQLKDSKTFFSETKKNQIEVIQTTMCCCIL